MTLVERSRLRLSLSLDFLTISRLDRYLCPFHQSFTMSTTLLCLGLETSQTPLFFYEIFKGERDEISRERKFKFKKKPTA